ncbi:MAG: response regulator transcription factor [Acidobacteria bacterium]|nr:response regulator transcription factor [Acidobacteriota bacterium]
MMAPRSPQPDGKVLRVDGLELDVRACSASLFGREVRLTPTELRLLEFLMRNPGVLFTRAEFLKAVWRGKRKINARTVDVHIARLRNKLQMGYNGQSAIQSVPSVGYRLRIWPERLGSSPGANRTALHSIVESLPEEKLALAGELLGRLSRQLRDQCSVSANGTSRHQGWNRGRGASTLVRGPSAN